MRTLRNLLCRSVLYSLTAFMSAQIEVMSYNIRFLTENDGENSWSYSPIQFLSKEMNDTKEVAEKVAFGPDGTFNGYKFDEPVTRRIDYIFTDDSFRVLKYAVLSDSKDLKYPSDHLPVLVELEIE